LSQTKQQTQQELVVPRDWPTKKEMAVMQVLQDAPDGLYGLQIVGESKGAVSRTSVYVLLSRLQDKGFVKVKRPQSDPDYPGLPRPLYRLTADGVRVLHAAESIGLRASGANA
jgi:DNA-binding PadR family transcriptional regulator